MVSPLYYFTSVWVMFPLCVDVIMLSTWILSLFGCVTPVRRDGVRAVAVALTVWLLLLVIRIAVLVTWVLVLSSLVMQEGDCRGLV